MRELVCSQTGDYPTAGQARCNYWMKTKNFGKKLPQIHIWGADSHMYAAKVVGGTESCKIILGFHHQKVVGNGPFSIPQPARLVCKGRLSLPGWIYPNWSGVKARDCLPEQGCTWGQTRWDGWLLSQLGTSRDSQSMAGYHQELTGTCPSLLAPSELTVIWGTSNEL